MRLCKEGKGVSFLDNTAGGGIGEFSNGQIALLRVYDSVLTSDDVESLARDPFPGSPTPVVPEPASLALLVTGGLPLFAGLRRRARA